MAGGASIALNLGTGKGTSIKQLVQTVERISNVRIPVEMTARREGDLPSWLQTMKKRKTYFSGHRSMTLKILCDRHGIGIEELLSGLEIFEQL